MKATFFCGFTKSFNTTTEGMRISVVGLRTTASYSATMSTLSSQAALIASCQVQSESG